MAPIPWATDAELAAHDAAVATRATTEANEEDVAREVRRLRVQAAARAQVAAEQAPNLDYTDEYLDRDALASLARPTPLIEGILPRNAYAILRGRDHSFKSFVAVDWAMSAATGTPCLGHAAEQVRVLYIAGEGAHGLAARIDAWETARGIPVPAGQLTLRRSALNLHKPGPDFDDLLDRVARGRYGLVIVDTLRRVSGAADGNSSEMGAVVDNLDRIKRATDGGTVVAIAHTDKNDHDTRGYSGIEDDADVVWAAKRKDSAVSLKLTKMKDGPDGVTINLTAIPVLDSLVLVAGGSADADLNDKARTILACISGAQPQGVGPDEIIAVTGIPKATVYRQLKALTESGRLSKVGPPRQSRYRLSAESR
jgi:hypothetical protein